PSVPPPSVRLPAIVVVTQLVPTGVILRSAYPSSTKIFPDPFTATPLSEPNLAALFVPSLGNPNGLGVPAIVETIPSGVILRMVLFPASETNKFPPESTAIPVGPAYVGAPPPKRARRPGPSFAPIVSGFPARVVTIWSGVIFRTV